MDLGTGSGCIALALKRSFPRSRVCGLDIDPGALEIALRNSRYHRLEADWIRYDILSAVPLPGGGTYDLVVSNPPYVTRSEQKEMEARVLNYEPARALFVEDEDPLLFYRAISQFCRNHLAPGGKLWVEINERFGKETAGLLTGSGMQDVIIHKDLYGKERYISATR
jgi:release factor glutamine methyltransferase